MKISKIIQSSVLAAALFVNTSCCATADAKTVDVEIDGKAIDFDVPAQIIDGSTMVPLRGIFEEIGALVKWDGETQTVSAKKSSKAVSLTVNSPDMLIDSGKTDDNGNVITENVTLDVPAQLVDGRTLVPLRAVSEAFNLDVVWDEDKSKVIISSKDTTDDSWKENTGTIELSDMTYTGDGVTVDGNKITITKGGDFTVSGTMDGSITVNTKDRVKLRLSNANISANGEPCIYFENADKAFITIENGTENTLVSSECDDGAIYSKDNLEIKGDGTLFVKSDTGHGIKVSDNLTVEEGTIKINAVRDGINVNDTFKMTGGDIDIESVCDGIDCNSIVMISGGNLNIKTTAEPTNISELSKSTEENTQKRMQEAVDAVFESSAKGIKAEWMMVISGGNITVNSTDHAIHCADETEITGGTIALNSEYGKGISGHGNVTIDGEETVIEITKSIEGIESKKVLTINNGDITAVSSDDTLNGTGGNSGNNFAPPANNGNNPTPPENGGERFAPSENANENMPQRQREFDRQNMTPPENMGEDRENTMPQKPDGFTANGGKGGMFGKNQKDTVIINGGNLELSSTKDDVIDANGSIVINGGVIKATLSGGGVVGNTAVLDADGSVTVGENATLISATRSGGTPTLSESQNAIMIYAETEHSADNVISVKSEDGKLIEEYAPTGSFQTVFVVSPKLEKGKTYTVSIGDETHNVTMSGGIITVGEMQNGMGGFGGGMSGGRGGHGMKMTPTNE